MKRLAAIAAALILAVAPAAAQQAQPERVALLIGNGDYDNAPAAETAVRDVRAVGDALKSAGWDVTTGTDMDRDAMRAALDRFAQRAQGAEDVLVYYSGHALRTGGQTYLAPVDQEADSLVDVEFGAVPLSVVMRILERASEQGVLLIDGAQLAGFEPTSFVEPGLADINAPEGVFVISAAPPGQAIRRSPGRDSRFAQLLVDEFLQPGADLVRTANKVGAPIWITGTAPAQKFALSPEGRPMAEGGLESEIELAYWRTAERTGRAEDYRAYLKRYPNGTFAEFARDRLDLQPDEQLPDRPQLDPAVDAENAMNLSRARVRQVQSWLSALGYEAGPADGLLGSKTRSALRDWERANDLDVNGYMSSTELDRLQQQGETVVAEQRRKQEEERRVAEAEDEAYWSETGARATAAGYRRYLDRFPQGLHAREARAALSALAEAEADDNLRQERREFRRAEREDTPEGWRDYLAQYPNGAFRDQATARLDELEGVERQTARSDRAQRIEQSLGLNGQDRLSVEQRLRSLGYEPGPLDGQFDRRSRAAITNYQASRGMEATGYLDRQTVVSIVQETSRTGADQPGTLVIDGTQVIRGLLDAFGQALQRR